MLILHAAFLTAGVIAIALAAEIISSGRIGRLKSTDEKKITTINCSGQGWRASRICPRR
jgi:hypothetical protein